MEMNECYGKWDNGALLFQILQSLKWNNCYDFINISYSLSLHILTGLA